MEATKAYRSEFIKVLLHNWRNHISDRQMTLILAFFIGFFASVAAFILHSIIQEIQWLLTSKFTLDSYNWLYLLFPVIGIFFTMIFVRYVVKDNISHGITRILYAISTKRSRLKAHNCWSSVIASAVTIGFGGSVGAEAPIVLTGSAIGSNLGQLFKMDNKTLMLLVGCGAAAAIAGIFKAPIAGLVFTLEVLMVDLSMASLLPILISCVTATCFTYIFVGSDSLFNFHLDDQWVIERVPACILLGVTCGLVSLYFIRAMGLCESMFHRMKDKPYLRLLTGGIMLSSLIFIFPVLYGEGNDAVNILLNGETNADWEKLLNNSLFYGHGNLLILYIALVILTKVFATSATNGGGGVGGTFAPSLYVGCMAGFLFAILVNTAGIAEGGLSIKNFALMGMAGVMSAVMHAPLMAIFLTAEMTGGYQLFLPLLIVSLVSYGTIRLFLPWSIYNMRLAQRGELLTHEKDKTVLTLLKIDNVIEKDFLPVHPEMSLKEMVDVISHSNRNLFPVTDEGGTLLGIVLLDDIRNIMFRPDLYRKIYVSKFMTAAPAKIEVGETMDAVMKKFDDTNAWNLPVVENGKYVGFVSKSKIFNSYRRVLKHYTDD